MGARNLQVRSNCDDHWSFNANHLLLYCNLEWVWQLNILCNSKYTESAAWPVLFDMSDILYSHSDDQQDIYERKYYALKRKCEEVQQVIYG